MLRSPQTSDDNDVSDWDDVDDSLIDDDGPNKVTSKGPNKVTLIYHVLSGGGNRRNLTFIKAIMCRQCLFGSLSIFQVGN